MRMNPAEECGFPALITAEEIANIKWSVVCEIKLTKKNESKASRIDFCRRFLPCICLYLQLDSANLAKRLLNIETVCYDSVL